MTVLLVLAFFMFFLTVDWFKTHPARSPRGTTYTTPGFEALGCLAQDGGEKVENDYQI